QQLVPLAALEVRVEDEAAGVEALEQHQAGGRLPVRRRGRERHRVGVARLLGARLLVPAIEFAERLLVGDRLHRSALLCHCSRSYHGREREPAPAPATPAAARASPIEPEASMDISFHHWARRAGIRPSLGSYPPARSCFFEEPKA